MEVILPVNAFEEVWKSGPGLEQCSFLRTNDSAIRRALLRKSQPHPGSYAIGQSVMYWRKRNTTGRRDVGRWHGPARVVCTEGTSTIWVAHGDRLLRCAPESVRSASLREWQNSSGTLDQQVQDLQMKNE